MNENSIVIDEVLHMGTTYTWLVSPSKPDEISLAGPNGKTIVSVKREHGREGHATSYRRLDNDDVIGYNLRDVARSILGVPKAESVEPGREEEESTPRQRLNDFKSMSVLFPDVDPVGKSRDDFIREHVSGSIDKLLAAIEDIRPALVDGVPKMVTYARSQSGERDLAEFIHAIRHKSVSASPEQSLLGDVLMTLMIPHASWALLDSELRDIGE